MMGRLGALDAREGAESGVRPRPEEKEEWWVAPWKVSERW